MIASSGLQRVNENLSKMRENLEEALTRPVSSFLGDGLRRITYPTDRIDLRAEVAKHVIEAGVTQVPFPLDDLHHRTSSEYQVQSARSLSRLSTNLTGTLPSLSHVYRDLVKYIACQILGFDVVFEANPPMRFHFPVPMPDRFRSRAGVSMAQHTDTLLGDYFEGINCWVPFTKCFGTCALQCATLPESIPILIRFVRDLDLDEASYRISRERFFHKLYFDECFQRTVLTSCRPVEIDYGEMLMFDPRTIHGTAENTENATRVSLDFRLVPLKAYNKIMRCIEVNCETPAEFGGMTKVRGSFYDERTAFQL
jgi:hypothetical protein